MTTVAEAGPAGAAREAGGRRFLMCPPAHFNVSYSINPWMRTDVPVDRRRALRQWRRLQSAYAGLGYAVEVIDPTPGLPDMVFAANGATVVGGRVLLARFRVAERSGEERLYHRWFTSQGFAEVHQASHANEGEGDLLLCGDRILAGYGFRTEIAAHAEASDYFGLGVVSLELVDPRFYHLDTALCVLGPGDVMYYPGAFSARARGLLADLFPGALVATEEEAAGFGLNAVSDGRNVMLPAGSASLPGRLADRGYCVRTVDVSEMVKAGGAVKCCTLEIREAS